MKNGQHRVEAITKKPDGCELCGDFPVELRGRCHPTAPLKATMVDDETLELRCYVPECNRLVATIIIHDIG